MRQLSFRSAIYTVRLAGVVSVLRAFQKQAAKLMGASQPDVSRMLRGHFRDFSAERLMRFLTALSCAVDIVVRTPGEPAARAGTIHLQPAQP